MDTGNYSNPLVTFGVVDVAQSSYAQLRIFWRLGGYHGNGDPNGTARADKTQL